MSFHVLGPGGAGDRSRLPVNPSELAKDGRRRGGEVREPLAVRRHSRIAGRAGLARGRRDAPARVRNAPGDPGPPAEAGSRRAFLPHDDGGRRERQIDPLAHVLGRGDGIGGGAGGRAREGAAEPGGNRNQDPGPAHSNGAGQGRGSAETSSILRLLLPWTQRVVPEIPADSTRQDREEIPRWWEAAGSSSSRRRTPVRGDERAVAEKPPVPPTPCPSG
jgi:hypothetical protein